MIHRYRAARGVLLAVLLLSVLACVPKSLLTPEGKASYIAREVALRIHQLEAVAVGANSALGPDGQPLLSTNATRDILQFGLAAHETLQKTPSGWIPAVTTGYVQLKARLTPEQLQQLAIPLAAIDAIMTEIAIDAGKIGEFK